MAAAADRSTNRRPVKRHGVRTHGIRSTYNDGCRCDACRVAARDYDRARKPPPAEPRYDLPVAPGILAREAWRARAACAGADVAIDVFFPVVGGRAIEAKRVCADCPVKADCLDYALGHNERWGIWGGLSFRERTQIRRRRAEQRAGGAA